MEQSGEPLKRVRNDLRLFYELSLALNLACAVGYSCLIYGFLDLESPTNDAGYYFLRAAIRIGDFLHVGQITAVSTTAVARRADIPWNLLQLTALASILAFAAILFFLLRFTYKTSAGPAGFKWAGGASTFLAAPACFLFVSRLTWDWKPQFGLPEPPSYPFWRSPQVLVFLAEILFVAIAVRKFPKRAISKKFVGALLVLHWGFWVPALWSDFTFPTRSFLLLIPPPLSGLAWIFYFLRPKPIAGESVQRRQPGTTSKVTAVLALLVLLMVLLAIWLPGRSVDLTRPRDMKSVEIQLFRGPGFGASPSYSVTIHGNGTVEFVGNAHVKFLGSQAGMVSSDQILRILQSLQSAHFASLEDRAFAWCFHTPTVSVSVTEDGRTKSVISDAFCMGTKSGLQAGFVKVADEIDTIVGSDQWVKCNGGTCQTHYRPAQRTTLAPTHISIPSAAARTPG